MAQKRKTVVVYRAPRKRVVKRKRKSNKNTVIFVLVLLVATLVGGVWLGMKNKDRFTKVVSTVESKILKDPPAWTKESLPDEDCIGIDVSHYQGVIDWNKLCFYYNKDRQLLKDNVKGSQRREVDFVIAKATEGKQTTDAQYKRNKEQARQHSKLFGAYHFFSVGVDAKAQAEHFIKVAALKKGDIIPILDVEPVKDKLPTADEVLVWLNTVEKYYDAKPIIYTGAHCYNTFFYKDKRFDKYEFWIARYAEERPQKLHLMWQVSDQGIVAGVNGKVDIDIFHGTLNEFKSAYTIK